MSNTAEIINFRARTEREEQRVADTDDGYTRLANELYEELIGANLTRNQAKVAHAVCRKTYGFNKKLDRVSDSQISELTRLPRQKVNKAKNELIAMRVLVREGSLIGPNKALSDWQIPDCHQNSDFVTKAVTKSVTKTVTGLSPKQGHTKDNITKDNKDSYSISNDIEVQQLTVGKKSQESNPSPQPQKPALSCEAVLAVYHEVLPEAKGVRLLSDKRRNQIRMFWKKASKITRQLDGTPFTLDSWRQYLTYISENCRWMLEDRQDPRSGRVWHRKGLEYFLSDETYLLVREGSKDDR